MNMDTIVLTLKSVVSKMINALKEAIAEWKKYDNETTKVANSLNSIATANKSVNDSFKESKQSVSEMSKELQKMQSAYKTHLKVFNEEGRGDNKHTIYNPTKDTTKFDPDAMQVITQESLNEEKRKIDELTVKMKEFSHNVDEQSGKRLPTNVVPKEAVDNVKKLGDKAKDSEHKISRLRSVMKSLGSVSKYIGSKGFDFLREKFNIFGKTVEKNVDGNLKHLKKFALGLIGVRTAMSVLTKSVNAYLSFDSDLQDSLTNSWNMLGSLLAPAIEFVARMFALATNYIAQFVNALTGINLVARANAKALQSQAKATNKARDAQRGLLGMDEITNLPTEPSGAGSEPTQIQVDDTIKSLKCLDEILRHLREGQWHLVGEDIARSINKMLKSIDWVSLKEKAYKVGYNFADFLNGLFEVDWGQIGTTIAESFNTFTELIKGFVDRFSFIQLGRGLGNMFNHAFLDIDWATLADTINKGIDGVGDGIGVFLTTFKWGDIGTKFGEFVGSIDWGNMLYQAIKDSLLAMTGLTEFIGGFFEGLFSEVADKISKKVDEIFTGLEDGTIDFNDWIEKAFKRAVKGIANSVIGTLNTLIRKVNNFITPFRALIVAFGNVTGKKWTLDKVSLPMIPTLAVGTPEIETEGLYHLHEGEMVVPKRYNPNTDGYDGNRDNRQIIDLLISLNSSMLEYAERPININMNGRKVAEATYDDMQQIDKNRNKSTAVVRS